MQYEFHNVMELIRIGHPESSRKLATKVNAIQIRDTHTHNRVSQCFHLLKANGAAEDVSYRKCVSHLFPEMATVLSPKPNTNSPGKKGGGNKKRSREQAK